MPPQTQAPPNSTPVSFRALDGVRLSGRLFGEGDVGVVLVHMGRPADSQRDWYGVAQLLARRGYVALPYDRRGVCPRPPDGCSHGLDTYSESWKDVIGAVRFLRSRGAREVVVVGASVGATSSVYAAARRRAPIAGVIEVAGASGPRGYQLTPKDIRAIPAPVVFVSAGFDGYGGDLAAREWYRWARQPKKLVLLPGTDHGTDILKGDPRAAARLSALIVDFVDRVANG